MTHRAEQFDNPSSAQLRRELTDLVSRRYWGQLSADDYERLNHLVILEPTARQLYVWLALETANLAHHAGRWRIAGKAEKGFSVAAGFDSTAPLGDLRTKLHELSLVDSVNKTPLPEGGQARHLGDRYASLSGVFQSFARPVLWSVALVGLLSYGTFVLIAWNLRPTRTDSVRPDSIAGISSQRAALVSSSAPIVATLTDMHDCVWQTATGETRLPIDSQLQEAQSLALVSGTAEITFAGGAVVALDGPSRFVVQKPGQGRLENGRLEALVPKRATGFRIETPMAMVLDLGTEFGVETDKRGVTEVQVYKGKVELHPGTIGDQSSSAVEPITLAAGDARRVEPSGRDGAVVVREVAPKAARLVRQVSAVSLQPIPVEGTYASSTYGGDGSELDAKYLIRGHGLNGDRHSANFRNKMWHTAFGHVKDVFVLFDLARPCRLNSMKVWNFNAAEGANYTWIGVKQADIYVSTSGTGDPLSRPEGWKLVAADQQFAPGTGKDDYATPQVIPLGNIEARFVAIVIDESLGHEPVEKPQPDCVGLSEVQFFGSRVESSQSLPKRNEK